MNRQISDKHVKIIKNLLVQKYSVRDIKSHMLIHYKVNISSPVLRSIKMCESYVDICPELNDTLFSNYLNTSRIDIKRIEEIKFAIVENFTEEEIDNVYNLTKFEWLKIRMLIQPYRDIAPQYNKKIEEMYHRKKNGNIDDKKVNEIKKEYVQNNGKIPLKKIASKYNVTGSLISTILSLKCYKNSGSCYNNKIQIIKSKIQKEKEKRVKEKVKQREKIKLNKIQKIKQKQKLLSEELKSIYDSKRTA